MQEKKKILMLGGTGAMGVYLAPLLLEMGYRVYVTSRSEHVSNEQDLIYLTGNAKDMDFLQPLLRERFDAIIDFMIYHTDEFKERYRTLLRSTHHYLFLSSYRVYGDNHGKPITEVSPRLLDSVDDAEYLATDEYGLTKARQENILRKAKRKNWTILRPAVTYSKERFQLGTMEAHEFLKRAFQGKPIIFPRQMLDKQATMSWAGDVAKMISLMVLNEKAMGETFTVSTSEHHTWGEILRIYQDLIGCQVKLVDLSVYASIFDRPYQIKYDRMLDRIIDNSKALEATGMTQEELMPLYDGLSIELANFKKKPVFHGNSTKSDQAIDKLTLHKSKVKLISVKKKLKTFKKLRRKKVVFKTIKNKIEKLPAIKTITYNKQRKIDLQQWNKPYSDTYKVGIITFHFPYNCGAVLQCYALQTMLQKMRIDVSVINYRPWYHQNRYSPIKNPIQVARSQLSTLPANTSALKKAGSVFDSFCRWFKYAKKYKKNKKHDDYFQPFIRQYLNETKVYRSINQLRRQYPVCNMYISGSDQLWNPSITRGQFDEAYFLKFGPDRIVKATYAVGANFDTVKNANSLLPELIEQLDAVALREDKCFQAVHKADPSMPIAITIDPTFLITKQDYKRIESKKTLESAPFIFTYTMPDATQRLVYQTAQTLGAREHIKVIDASGQPTAANRAIKDHRICGPAEFLWYMSHAKYVITNSFHGTAFSVIMEKQFVSLPHSKTGNRVVGLLDQLGLAHRALTSVNAALSEIKKPINYTSVNKKKAVLVANAKKYLIKCMSIRK